MQTVTDIQATLDKISHSLFEGSMNYCATFKLVRCENMARRALDEIVSAALADRAVIDRASTAQPVDVVESLKTALAYEGDSGSHPSPEYIASDRFKHDAASALAQLGQMLENADRIVSFSLKEGHPFYPVFWDFAFSVEKRGDAYVFIGSSSD